MTQADLTGDAGTLRLKTGFPNGVPQQAASRKVSALC